MRENLLFPEASCGFERSLLEQVPLGVSSAHQSGSRTVCVCVSLFLSLDLREAFTSNHHSFCWTQHSQEHEFCSVLTQHSLRINLVCGKPDPAGTWVRHRLRLWTRDYCFFSEAWNQLKWFLLLWFGLIPGYFSILE